MKKVLFGFAFAVALPLFAQQKPIYLDASKPMEVRVEDALKRLTVEEKVAMLHAQSKFSSPGVPRLGIPSMAGWGNFGDKLRISAGTSLLRRHYTARSPLVRRNISIGTKSCYVRISSKHRRINLTRRCFISQLQGRFSYSLFLRCAGPGDLYIPP